jgi:hypothetical protein
VRRAIRITRVKVRRRKSNSSIDTVRVPEPAMAAPGTVGLADRRPDNESGPIDRL